MNEAEAKRILSEQLTKFSGRSYDDLALLVRSEHTEALETTSPDGSRYSVELQFFWDNKPDKTIRIFCSIGDGGIRAFVPLCDSVLIERPQ